jgi:hypothetical protein
MVGGHTGFARLGDDGAIIIRLRVFQSFALYPPMARRRALSLLPPEAAGTWLPAAELR